MSDNDYKSNIPADLSGMDTDQLASRLIELIELGESIYFGVLETPPIDNNIPKELIADVIRLQAELTGRWLCSAISIKKYRSAIYIR